MTIEDHMDSFLSAMTREGYPEKVSRCTEIPFFVSSSFVRIEAGRSWIQPQLRNLSVTTQYVAPTEKSPMVHSITIAGLQEIS